MKLEDIPTPDTTRLFELIGQYGVLCAQTQELAPNMEFADQMKKVAALEQRLALAVAENARLKTAMDKYSEDEMLLIERCAKVCESVYESYESKCNTWPEARPDALSGAEDCIRAIRELKEAKK